MLYRIFPIDSPRSGFLFGKIYKRKHLQPFQIMFMFHEHPHVCWRRSRYPSLHQFLTLNIRHLNYTYNLAVFYFGLLYWNPRNTHIRHRQAAIWRLDPWCPRKVIFIHIPIYEPTNHHLVYESRCSRLKGSQSMDVDIDHDSTGPGFPTPRDVQSDSPLYYPPVIYHS